MVFHIGFSKTGSSSIQRHLSLNGTIRIAGTNYVYCSFNHKGAVITGTKLCNAVKFLSGRYVSSTNKLPLCSESLIRLRRAVESILSTGRIPVFSHEDWGSPLSRTKKKTICRDDLRLSFSDGLAISRLVAQSFLKPAASLGF